MRISRRQKKLAIVANANKRWAKNRKERHLWQFESRFGQIILSVIRQSLDRRNNTLGAHRRPVFFWIGSLDWSRWLDRWYFQLFLNKSSFVC